MTNTKTKTYFIIKTLEHIFPASSDFYNRDFGEAIGDTILETISAPDMETAWKYIKANY